MKRLFPILLLAAVAAVVVWSLYKKNEVSSRDYIEVSGTIEYEEVNVGSKEGGRVSEVAVKEGDEVMHGQTIVKLESVAMEAMLDEARAAEDMARAKLELMRNGYDPEDIEAARAAVRGSEAQLDLLKNGYDAEEISAARAGLAARKEQAELVRKGTRKEQVDAARAELNAARERYNNLRALNERQKSLLAAGVVSRQTADDTRTAMEGAAQGVKAAKAMYDMALNGPLAEEKAIADKQVEADRAKLKQLERGPRKEQKAVAENQVAQGRAKLRLLERGPRAEEIAQALAALEQARARVRTIETRLAEMEIKSPSRAVVDVLDLHPGDIVAPGEVAAKLVLREKPWVRVFVPENMLALMKQGGAVILYVDALPNEKFSGLVTRIAEAAEFTPRNVQTPEGRATQVFRTKIVIDDPSSRLRAGMTAAVRFKK